PGDQVGLDQQGFDLAAGRPDFDFGNQVAPVRQQVARIGAAQVASHAYPQVLGLADVERFALPVVEDIRAATSGQESGSGDVLNEDALVGGVETGKRGHTDHQRSSLTILCPRLGGILKPGKCKFQAGWGKPGAGLPGPRKYG